MKTIPIIVFVLLSFLTYAQSNDSIASRVAQLEAKQKAIELNIKTGTGYVKQGAWCMFSGIIAQGIGTGLLFLPVKKENQPALKTIGGFTIGLGASVELLGIGYLVKGCNIMHGKQKKKPVNF